MLWLVRLYYRWVYPLTPAGRYERRVLTTPGVAEAIIEAIHEYEAGLEAMSPDTRRFIERSREVHDERDLSREP